MMDPINVSGFVSVANVIKADRELWTLIRGSTTKGIRKEGVGSNAEYPLWKAMKKHMNDFFVDRLLVPSQHATPYNASKRKKRDTSEDSTTGKDRRSRREGKWSKNGRAKGKGKLRGKPGSKGKGKGKGSKAKGKKGKGGPVPEELIGLIKPHHKGLRTHLLPMPIQMGMPTRQRRADMLERVARVHEVWSVRPRSF